MSFARGSALRRIAIERMSEHDVRWRSLGALFIAGGALADLSLLLPVDEGSDTRAVLIIGIVAIAGGLGMIALAERLPKAERWLSLSLAAGTLLITAAVVFNDAAASPYALVYVWVGFDAFFFLSRRSAYVHLTFVGLCYAGALLLTAQEGQADAGRWLLLMGTVGVIGTLADLLRTRSEELIEMLGEAARTDPLTDLLNRRGFEERMEEELRRARRARTPVGLVVGDLDHFKSINDRFGHHRGDDALRLFGDVARSVTREVDGIARLGGEEFAIVLPDADEHGALLLAERLRRRVRGALAGYGPRLSLSCGVSSFPRDGDDPDALLRAGDQALYAAKRLGRDRSVIFSPEITASLRAGEARPAKAVEQLPAVLILAETLDLRDTGTAMHSQTVGRYAEAIAAAIGLPPARVERVRLAGLLHDLGKIGVPDPILRKPGPLDPAEWAEMRKHPELGARILAGANLDDLSGWVLAHHERPDGKGYPAGLSGDEVPLEARILAVADAFEAMTSDRVYRAALPRERALDELRHRAGTQFDRIVVDALLGCQADVGVPDPVTAPGSADAAHRTDAPASRGSSRIARRTV